MGRQVLRRVQVRLGNPMHGNHLRASGKVYGNRVRHPRQRHRPRCRPTAVRDERPCEVQLGRVRFSVEHGRERDGRAVTLASKSLAEHLVCGLFPGGITMAGLALLALSGATGCDTGGTADLPSGWESAKAVTSFSQAACDRFAADGGAGPEGIDVTGTAGSVHVAYHHAHFRCEQTVEGFVRTGSKAADFLVQPTDMNPSKVAACDCYYEVVMGAGAPAGPTAVTVYRRWDHVGGNPIDPVEVGTASVTVP
jgi:hypothetical protein